MLKITPVTRQYAFDFVNKYHRHHKAPQGWKFGIGCFDTVQDKIVGVAIVGRPVNRQNDDNFTLEVTRNCTDGTSNVCSKLYGSCRRITKELGYRRIITYVLFSEQGISLTAAGWKQENISFQAPNWNTREGKTSVYQGPADMKVRYGCDL